MTKPQIYFYLLAPYIILMYSYLLFTKHGAIGFFSLFDAIFLFGVYGYAFKKQLFNYIFWKSLGLASIAIYLYSASRSIFALSEVGWLAPTSIAIVIAPYIPLSGVPIFLLKYGDKSNEIWQNN